MSTHNYQLLIEKLNQFIRKYYKNQLLRGFIYSMGLLFLFFIGVTFLEYYAHFNILLRTVLFYSFITASGFVLIKFMLIPLMGLYKLGKTLSYEQAAKIIGNHFSSVKDKILNVLQLQQQTEAINLQLSSELLSASIDQKIKELKPVPFTSAIHFSENKKYLKYALIPVLTVIILLFAAPSMITDSTKRLVKHRQFFEKQAPFQFVIINKNLNAVAQQDYELKIKLTGDEIPENTYINIDGNEFKLEKENVVNFRYLFKNVQRDIDFQLQADGFKSKEYKLIALPNPVLLNFDITLSYPAYLHQKDEQLKNTGDLLIPAGTKVTWNFNTENTESIQLKFNDTSFTLSPSTKDYFKFSQLLFRNKNYSVKTSNHYLNNNDSVSYLINVIPDAYPSITIDTKVDSSSSKRFFFNGEVKDDHGFNKLTFNYRFIVSNDSAALSKAYTELTTNSSFIPINTATTQDRFFYTWDLSSLGISPGDQIEYYFEIWDNDGVTGSKSTRSQKSIFKAPTLKEINENTDKNNNQIKNELEKSVSAAQNIQKELSDLQRKVAEKKSLSWEEKKKLEDLLKKQKELQKKVEEIKNNNEKNNKQQNEYKQQNDEILEKQKMLEELFEKIMSPELKQKYEELQKLLEQMDKNKVQEALEKMKLDNKDLLKELDRNLEIFKQLELEQKIQQNIDKLNELSKKEEELSKKSEDKNTDSKELKNKQDELSKEFQDLKKNLDDMEKKNNELEQPMKMENTKQQQNDIEKEMQKSSEQLNNNQKKNASKSQKNAVQEMQQMSEQLTKMQQEQQQEQEGEDINKLRKLLENLIQLSFGQEALMVDLSKTKANNPQYVKLNQRQRKLQDDSKMIEDSLLALSKRVPQIQATVNHEINAINMNMERATDEIKESQSVSVDGRNHQQEALSRQQLAMTSINNLALMLNEALQQMQANAKKPGQPGSGSCKKPGGNGNKPSMSNMRQMQEQLNQQIQKLKEQMEKNGNKPGQQSGQKPGLNGQGISQELAKLAAQQEALRKEVQKISEQLNKDGKGGGNIGKLAEKMEETETDLVNKMISQETIKRQQEILTRMLESEKAEKEREMDEQRQSNEAKNEHNGNPNAFLQYNILKQKEAELLKTVPPSLNPFFKLKVNQYFNTFEK